ncbi:MAG: hypothetical protein MUF54_13405 [Polyangiaceae bacterium]|nr:hypothetical protein [Polyangiaceae bacterium]
MSPDERFHELNEAFVQQVARWFTPHIRAGRLRRLPQDLTIALLLGPSQEFSRLLLSGRTTTDIKTASDTLAEATWRALMAPLNDIKPRNDARAPLGACAQRTTRHKGDRT